MPGTTEDRVKDVVAKVLKVDRARILSKARFTADLGAESIQSVELVAAFEEEFNITMREDEALSVQTVGDAIGYIDRCMQEQLR